MLSVVIPCYQSEATLPVCLEALARQSHRDFEVILVDSSPDPEPLRLVAIPWCEACALRVVHIEERLLPHAARNRGAALARGNILVFTDPDCAADPHWLRSIAEAHHAGHVAVGGPVTSLPGWRNRAVHMAKYGWWLPGGRAGPRTQFPSASMSFTRELWERVGPFPGDLWAGDTFLSWRVREAGADLWFEPAALTMHLDHGSIGMLLRTFHARGADYAAARSRIRNWSRLHCGLRTLAAPLVPVLMSARTARAAIASGQTVWYLVTVPVLAASTAVWAAGEARALWGQTWQN